MAQYNPILFLYNVFQWILDALLSPRPPPPHAHLRRPKIAIIGAGITGVSAAAHCVGHGFDVTIFEAEGPDNLGGIWSVNLTLPLVWSPFTNHHNTESQYHQRPPNTQHNVPLPSICSLGQRLSKVASNRRAGQKALGAIQTG